MSNTEGRFGFFSGVADLVGGSLHYDKNAKVTAKNDSEIVNLEGMLGFTGGDRYYHSVSDLTPEAKAQKLLSMGWSQELIDRSLLAYYNSKFPSRETMQNLVPV